jgi:acyl-CoA synthetase (AMP-forming)/AMP-acid ligase II
MLALDHLKTIIKNNPKNIAITTQGIHLTYEQLGEFIQKRSDQLRNYQLPQGAIVTLETESLITFVVNLFACIHNELVFVPIEYSLPQIEKDLLYRELGEIALRVKEQEAFISKDLDNSRRLPGTAMIQFTSGSTGKPKGLLIGQQAMLNRALYLTQSANLNTNDRTLCTLPLTHSHAIDCLILTTLYGGGHLFYLAPQYASPMTIFTLIEQEKITFFSSLPSFYQYANQLVKNKKIDLSSLRLPFCGSAALYESTAQEFKENFGIRILQGYGLAEICVIAMNLLSPDKPTSVGRPIKGIEFQISDDKELLVRSNTLYSGILNNSDPLPPFLATGDLVEVDQDGDFYITGRKKEFLNINGLKIYPAEIERILMQFSWPGDIVVKGEVDPENQEERLAIHLTEATRPQQIDELISFIEKNISGAKRPSLIYAHKNLPKSPLGKVLKEKLRTDHVLFHRSL